MSTTDAWYPLADTYYETSDLPAIPVRQGDLLLTPDGCTDSKGKPWHGCVVVHPSCEVITGKSDRIHVCRVRPLKNLGKKSQPAVVKGETVDDEGVARISHAHTFFLPPAAPSGPFATPMFVDFREIETSKPTETTPERRIAALTHDTRLYFIRRHLYWQQRWMLPLESIRQLEAERIAGDPYFQGPRPSWAEG